MITAWQFASLPIWAFGILFCLTSLALMTRRSNKEVLDRRLVEAGIGVLFGIPFLILAAWLWS